MADLVQMENSFKQNSGNVLLHYHYAAPQPDGVLMITGLEMTCKQSNTWQNPAERKTWFDMRCKTIQISLQERERQAEIV